MDGGITHLQYADDTGLFAVVFCWEPNKCQICLEWCSQAHIRIHIMELPGTSCQTGCHLLGAAGQDFPPFFSDTSFLIRFIYKRSWGLVWLLLVSLRWAAAMGRVRVSIFLFCRRLTLAGMWTACARTLPFISGDWWSSSSGEEHEQEHLISLLEYVA